MDVAHHKIEDNEVFISYPLDLLILCKDLLHSCEDMDAEEGLDRIRELFDAVLCCAVL